MAEGQGGGLQLCKLECRGEKSPQDLPTGPPWAWLRLRSCFQLLATFTSYCRWDPLTATNSGTLQGNQLGTEAASAGWAQPLCRGPTNSHGMVLSQGTQFPQPQPQGWHPAVISPRQGPEHPWPFAEVPIRRPPADPATCQPTAEPPGCLSPARQVQSGHLIACVHPLA